MTRSARDILAAAFRLATSNGKVRFVVVGGINTLSGYLVTSTLYFLLARLIGLYGVIALATVINITISYLNHKRLTFKTSGNYLAEYLRFYLIAGISIVLAFLLLPVFIKDLQWNAYLSIGLVAIINVVIGYFGHSRFSFRLAPQNT